MISAPISRALDEVATRERDAMQIFTPGASAAHGDAQSAPANRFVLDPLSAAAPAGAYFVTRDERGALLFTRDGALQLRDGTLTDAQNRPALGYAGPQAGLQPVTIDPVDARLGYARSARIESDGAVVYERPAIDPRTGARENVRVVAGYLALARFAPGTALVPADPGHAYAPAGVAPYVGRAGSDGFGAIAPFAREGSGIDVDASLQRLQEAYLALDAIRAATKAQDSIGKTAMDLVK